MLLFVVAILYSLALMPALGQTWRWWCVIARAAVFDSRADKRADQACGKSSSNDAAIIAVMVEPLRLSAAPAAIVMPGAAVILLRVSDTGGQ